MIRRNLFVHAIVWAVASHVAVANATTFKCDNPQDSKGKVVGDGHCVAFIKACAGAPETEKWKAGKKVRKAEIPIGTAIATFKDGKYAGNVTGNHAAIYDGQDTKGIFVWDQWKGQPVHRRHIEFRGGKGSPSNDGDTFSVIEAD
jgi:hypothetical protein